MTTHDAGGPFSALAGAEFMVLTTYRRSGVAVPTTVWFAAADGLLYVTTMGQSGKARRIQASPQVLVAPSDQVGNLRGPQTAGRAHLLTPGAEAAALAALQAKYGEQFSAVVGRMGTAGRVYIAIVPA